MSRTANQTVLNALCEAARTGIVPDEWTRCELYAKARPVTAEDTQDLLRLLCGEHIQQLFLDCGDVLGALIPEVRPMLGFDQESIHHRYDLWEHTVRTMAAIRPDPLLRLTMLLHDVGKSACYYRGQDGHLHYHGHAKHSVPVAESVLRRLDLTDEFKKEVLVLVRHHDTPMGETDMAVRRKLMAYGEARYRLLLEIRRADYIGQGTKNNNLERLEHSRETFERLLVTEGQWTEDKLAIKKFDLFHWGVAWHNADSVWSQLQNYALDDPQNNTKSALLRFYRNRKPAERVLTVRGMSGKNCALEVYSVLNRLNGVFSVEVDLPSGRTTITGTVSYEELCQALTNAGYEVAI